MDVMGRTQTWNHVPRTSVAIRITNSFEHLTLHFVCDTWFERLSLKLLLYCIQSIKNRQTLSGSPRLVILRENEKNISRTICLLRMKRDEYLPAWQVLVFLLVNIGAAGTQKAAHLKAFFFKHSFTVRLRCRVLGMLECMADWRTIAFSLPQSLFHFLSFALVST